MAPFFPMLLSLFEVSGIDPLDGVRWLNAFSFGANILLVGFLLHYFTKGSIYTSILSSLLMLTSTVMLRWLGPSFFYFLRLSGVISANSL